MKWNSYAARELRVMDLGKKGRRPATGGIYLLPACCAGEGFVGATREEVYGAASQALDRRKPVPQGKQMQADLRC